MTSLRVGSDRRCVPVAEKTRPRKQQPFLERRVNIMVTDPAEWSARQQESADAVRFADLMLRSAELLGDRRLWLAAADALAHAQRVALEAGLTYADIGGLRGVQGNSVYMTVKRLRQREAG